jgi:RNA polymerase sigma-70 factor (ECF subfamily)
LQGVRRQEPQAWRRLVVLYAPVVARWARRAGLQPADVDDVLQEVFRAVAQHVSGFRRDQGSGSFHAWLATIARTRLCDHFRRQGREPPAMGGSDFQQQLAPADDSSSSAVSERHTLIRRVLDLVRPEFAEKTWHAFTRAVIDEQDTAVIARDLAMTANGVRIARSRVLRRLREVLGELLDGPGSDPA